MGDYRNDNLSTPALDGTLHTTQGSALDSFEKRLPFPELQDFGLPGFLAGDSRLQFALAREIQKRLCTKCIFTKCKKDLS